MKTFANSGDYYQELKSPNRPYSNQYQAPKKIETMVPTSSKLNTGTNQRSPVRLLTAAEMASRKEQGLCYNCEEKFTFGHRCKQRITYMMMTEQEELFHLQIVDCHDELMEDFPFTPPEEVPISLNAIVREDGLTIIKLVGEVNGHKLNILIDIGSTLSFI